MSPHLPSYPARTADTGAMGEQALCSECADEQPTLGHCTSPAHSLMVAESLRGTEPGGWLPCSVWAWPSDPQEGSQVSQCHQKCSPHTSGERQQAGCVGTSGSLWGPFWVRARAASRGPGACKCVGINSEQVTQTEMVSGGWPRPAVLRTGAELPRNRSSLAHSAAAFGSFHLCLSRSLLTSGHS